VRWEHISLTFGTDDSEPWTTASQEQMEAVRDLQRADYECVGVTTLADGALFLMFKRPARKEPVDIVESKGIQIGFALAPSAD